MKLSLELTVVTQSGWVDAVMADLPSFLQDHADCERKASALVMSLVAKYSDRLEIIPELIATGVEELEHFQQVYEVMRQRGIPLVKEIQKDPYITALMKLLHSDKERRFLDRLLLASIIECRGAERFRLVSGALCDDKELQEFYHDLWVSESRHGHIFVGMALEYFEKDCVFGRLTELNEAEGRIVDGLEFRAALH
ncbi:MAG: tRNA-(ms[2]io[6]A)-hydroxylase [Verrucomicrobiota bacterium]|jgi:tRNA-(ms[2]io[6]A)-hydroxylase|nr:tRNA-(ms[2]io[6]A)-hydroxylase [Verrucomicrobiota bacterium]MDP7048809.1 tRNA-(ms[2]io[6]A)-hydroxylase [Verrucomicrobiota bacterium]